MALSTQTFEKLDGLYGQLLRMGDFLTCADGRAYVQTSSRLLDACLDAGMDFDTPDHIEWAGEQITRALVSA